MPTASSSSQRSVASSTALATLLACLVLLPLLGHKPLTEWDEGIYAEAAREMLGGSWVVPHWPSQLWLEKPPLMLWITATFFKLFGVTEFWARAGSAFAGIAIVALLHRWLARTHDLLSAWLSSIFLLATFGFLHVCHVGEMDVLLSLGCCISLIGLSQVQAQNRSGWYLAWLGLAIAVMTKGSAGVTIPITTVIFAIIQRWPWKRFGVPFAAGFAVFLALVLPWHLAMYQRLGHQFSDFYFGTHMLARATQQIEGHRTHWWYYVVVLLASAPPFVLLYPFAVSRGFRRSQLQPWAIFAFTTILFFTIIQTRLPHYIAPAYPALTVLAAVYVADWLRPRLGNRAKPYWTRTITATAVVWTLAILATHSTLKSLHSADLAGPGVLDNKEADFLLKSAPLPNIPGPLLYLRDGRLQSIATVVFYAKRPVQQVVLTPPPPASPLDLYVFNPQLITDAAQAAPRLILLDKSLISALPTDLTYTPVRASATEELGTISRNAQ